MTRRFFVEASALAGDRIEIEGALAHRMAKVLRMHAGDELVLFDGSGEDVRVRLEDVHDRRICVVVMARGPGPREPRLRVRLPLLVPKSSRYFCSRNW